MALPSKKTSSPLLEGETLGARVLRNRLLGVRKEERLSSSRKEREWSLLLDALEGIARKPLYRAKEEDALVRSELSGALPPESFLRTMRDPSLWRRKPGAGMLPEYVHAIRYEDDMRLYENLLTIRAIRLLRSEVLSSVQESTRGPESIESLYLREKAVFGEKSFLIDMDEHSARVGRALKERGESAKKEEASRKLLRRIDGIRGSRFYRTLRGERQPETLLPTNVLLHHPLYKKVYRYLLNRRDASRMSPVERDIRFILAMERVLKAKRRMTAEVSLYLKDGKLGLVPFSFTRRGVKVEVSLEGEELRFHCSYKGHEATRKILLDGTERDDSYRLMTSGSLGEGNAFLLLPEEEMEGQCRSFLASLATFIPYKGSLRNCPVCGGRIAGTRPGEERECPHCASRFARIPASIGTGGDILIRSFWGR